MEVERLNASYGSSVVNEGVFVVVLTVAAFL